MSINENDTMNKKYDSVIIERLKARKTGTRSKYRENEP